MGDYPEQKPTGIGNIEKFTFSLSSSDYAVNDVRLRVEALETRLRKLDDNCLVTVNEQRVPLLSSILALSHSRSELRKLGECLTRAAELVEELDKLKAQAKVLDLAKEDPTFFAWAFSDVTNDIDDYLKKDLEA